MMRPKKNRTSTERAIVEFLLQRLSESKRQKFEGKYFRDRLFQEQVLAMEQDLILSYLHGDLSVEECHLFEQSFLASERRKRLIEAARQFVAAANLVPPLRMPDRASRFAARFKRLFALDWITLHRGAFRWGIAALAVFICASWLLPRSASPQRPEPIAFKPSTPAPPAEPAPTIQKSTQATTVKRRRIAPRPGPAAPRQELSAAFDFSLDVTMVRTQGDLTELRIPANVTLLNLNLKRIEPPHARYRVVLKSIEGEEIWRGERLKQRRQGVLLQIPTKLIQNGEFVLDIYGIATHHEPTLVSQSFLHTQPR